jgi:hypothetical protein
MIAGRSSLVQLGRGQAVGEAGGLEPPPHDFARDHPQRAAHAIGSLEGADDRAHAGRVRRAHAADVEHDLPAGRLDGVQRAVELRRRVVVELARRADDGAVATALERDREARLKVPGY